jgi:DNA-binding NtrC family response regulator
MTKPPKIETAANGIVTVLSASPIEQDHVSLAQIFNRSKSVDEKIKFKVNPSPTLPSALAVLRENRIPIVVCERDLSPGTWRELLDHSARLPVPPTLIVTSRFAEERLWVDALTFGAYDVLIKPFNAQEVCRVVEGAWHHWRGQHDFRRSRSR